MNAAHTLGQRGEELAARYLEAHGLVVLSRNWRHRDGELDIVATDGGRLVVCEVKTRSGERYGVPEEAVTTDKARRIRHLTTRWCAAHQVGRVPTRFDVISVLWPREPGATPTVRHLKEAF